MDSDTCGLCYSGYYLSTDGRYCIKYPFGVINCLEFSNELSCSKCISGHILVDNNCEKIQESQFIANCDF